MAKGFPDGTTPVALKGLHLGVLKSVAVDVSGQIITIIKGASGVDVAVDANGQLLSILRGWDGANYHNLLVDGAGKIIAVLQGTDGTNLQTLKVDDQGRMIAMVKAMFDATVKDVACDTDGNLTLNIAAQNLGEIINRPKYGGVVKSSGSGTITNGQTATPIDIEGKGILYGGVCNLETVTAIYQSVINLIVDGSNLSHGAMNFMMDSYVTSTAQHSVHIIKFDEVNYKYVIGFPYGITFESTVELTIGNYSLAGNMEYDTVLLYALI